MNAQSRYLILYLPGWHGPPCSAVFRVSVPARVATGGGVIVDRSSGVTRDTDLTEEELIALRCGDRDVFGRVVRTHHRGLTAVARGIVGHDDAEEIVQRAWIKAFEGIASFAGRARLRTWLTAIVINEGRMHLRSRRSMRVAEAAESIDLWVANS